MRTPKILFFLLTTALVVAFVVFNFKLLFKKDISNFFPSKPKANIIIICIDSLRSDHLGCYGYNRNTSPNIDEFARENILFENNFSQSPYSLSSHVSMLSSLYPLTHRVLEVESLDLAALNKYRILSEIISKKGFVPSLFAQGGYFTLKPLFVRGFNEVFTIKEPEIFFKKIHHWFLQKSYEKKFVFIYTSILNPPYSYREQAKDLYKDKDFLSREVSSAKKIISRGLNEERFQNLSDKERSLILFYNLIEEYDPKGIAKRPLKQIMPDNWPQLDDYDRQLNCLIDSYDANIRFLDEYLGSFFQMLKASGIWDDSLIIITSSHGQEFREHGGIAYTFELYDTILKTPLLIKLPGSEMQRSSRITQFSESVDIMPTILDIFNIDYKGPVQGVSLLPVIKGQAKKAKKAVMGFYADKRSIRTQYYKYITCNKKDCKESRLYNLLSDPGEDNNLISLDAPVLEGIDCLIYKHIRSTQSKKAK
ncbi:MAG: sulfatase [Candidatus Omnitrophica bacterium]|nr:sulfatase [Candidatus Omnitrophota bacterium]